MSEPRNMREFLDQHLPVIDAMLGQQGRPLGLRVMTAAQLIMDHCVVSVSGESTDDYLRKPWFSGLVREVRDWYRDRYGHEMLETSSATISGVIRIWSTLFLVVVPLVDRRRDEKPGRIRVTFPQSIMPHEDPCEWLRPMPQEVLSSASLREQVRADIALAATRLRISARRAQGSDIREKGVSAMLHTVPDHLSTGAEYLIRGPERYGLAVWECGHAVEKLLKAFLHQCGKEADRSHDLLGIGRDAVDVGLDPEVLALLSRLPRGKVLVDYRYDQGPQLSMDEAFELYSLMLAVAALVGGHLTTRVLPTAEFVLRRWDWGIGFADRDEEHG
jgi:HEPN domain-containing protein